MRTKLFLFVPFLVLALVLSACGTAAAPSRTLNVSGNGTVYLTPDIAYIYLGVHIEDPDLANAVSRNNAQAQALVDALKKAGVAAKDIQTSNFSVYSNNNQSVDKTTGQTVTSGSYAVDNTVYVTLRDLSHLGNVLNTAVNAGANNINSISFDVADKSTAMQQARQKAMANAGSLAAELTKTANVKLGEIQSVSYSDNSSTPYYGLASGGGASAPNASVPIQPGQTQISVSVSVTYTIQ